EGRLDAGALVNEEIDRLIASLEHSPELDNVQGPIEIPAETYHVLVGSGGQAAVYSCHLSINGSMRKVAIKAYYTQCSAEELEMLRKLEHANIVQFFGITCFRSQQALILEYCESSLRTLLSYNNVLDKLVVSTHAISIASGIAYLHANNVLHRDLKPENVLIDSNGTAKLCDFGVSRTFTDRSTLFTVIGTRRYMAPELIRNEKCTEKIDLWSFGIVLWELITCRLPYDGIDDNVLMYAIGKKKAELPMPDNGAVESLPLLLNRCWAEDPHDRATMERIICLLSNLREEVNNMSNEMLRGNWEYSEHVR
ncbi:hypothetical protein PFISCL1PPCAC_4854, partial [Pristionchus fissidentatus]